MTKLPPSRSRTTTLTVLIASLCAPLAAHAEGIPGFVWPALIMLASHLYPAVDLARRKAWAFTALYVFSQPVVWGLAGSIGYVVLMFSAPETRTDTFSPGVIAALAVLAVTPFIYWKMLLGWLDFDAEDSEP